MLAADAARLILPRSSAVGTALLSRWLIHLADRDEPLAPASRRRYLHWPRLGLEHLLSPTWIPVTPQTPPTCWWAARLPNVFQLSRDAVEEAFDIAANASATAVLTSEDKTILVVLSEAGRALLYSEIVRESAKLVREKGGISARKSGLVTLSETKVGERAPILETQGLVSRPLGPQGNPTHRKGIGITDKGRAWLEINSKLVR
jgi:hypothetical protein